MTYVDVLRRRQAAWETRPLVRRLYGRWFELVAAELSSVTGKTVELGAGISKFREHRPEVISTDLEITPWSDQAVDAELLLFPAGSLANLVLIDVFHHLKSPGSFLDEAQRTLAPGGRAVLLEPFCSPLSTVAYRLFHRERVDLSAAPFADDDRVRRDPAIANQARATLAFFHVSTELSSRWPGLEVVARRRLAVLAYPLSGGFDGVQLVPNRLATPLLAFDRALEPVLGWACAFRCLVVLQRRPETADHPALG